MKCSMTTDASFLLKQSMEQHILDTVKDSYVYNTYEMYTKKQLVFEDTF